MSRGQGPKAVLRESMRATRRRALREEARSAALWFAFGLVQAVLVLTDVPGSIWGAVLFSGLMLAVGKLQRARRVRGVVVRPWKPWKFLVAMVVAAAVPLGLYVAGVRRTTVRPVAAVVFAAVYAYLFLPPVMAFVRESRKR